MSRIIRKKAFVQAIKMLVTLSWVIMQMESAQAATLTSNSSITVDNHEIKSINLVVPNSLIIVNQGSIIMGTEGTISGNFGQISGGSNALGGNITITTDTIIFKPVPEPNTIAGSVIAGSLALLMNRKQAKLRKAKV